MNHAIINVIIFILFDIISYVAFQLIGLCYFKAKTTPLRFFLLGVFCVFSTTLVYQHLPTLNLLFSILIQIILFSQYCTQKIRVILFSLILTLLHAFIEMLSCGMVALFGQTSIHMVLTNNSLFLLCEILKTFFFYLFALYFYTFYKKRSEFPKPYSRTIVVFCSFLSLSMFWLLFFISKNNTDFGYLILIGMFLIIIIFNTVIFYCLCKISDYYKSEQDAQFMNQYLIAQKKLIEKKQKNDESIQMMSHNMKHILKDISILLEQKNYATIKEIIRTQLDLLIHSDSYVKSPDPFLNAFLDEKLSYAHSLGIHFETSVLLDGALPFQPDKISFILGNLLDNAIEYLKSSGIEHPAFYIHIRYQGGLFILQIANPVQKDIDIHSDMTIRTTKKETHLHGYGLKSIRNTVRQLNGTFEIHCQNHIFSAEILIPGC